MISSGSTVSESSALLGGRADERELRVRARRRDDLLPQLGVDVVAPVRDAHPLEVVDHPRDLGHLHRGDDLDAVDLDVVRRPAPVREHLDDGRVELLVAGALGMPSQVSSRPSASIPRSAGRLVDVGAGGEQDDPPGRRVDLVDAVQQLDAVTVGERHLRCHQGDSVVVAAGAHPRTRAALRSSRRRGCRSRGRSAQRNVSSTVSRCSAQVPTRIAGIPSNRWSPMPTNLVRRSARHRAFPVR